MYRQDAFLTHSCRLTQQEVGLKAIAALDKSLDEFTALLDAKDKQEIPLKQQEALGFVGQIEEAMVKGFPYEVPAQYANLPQLKVPPYLMLSYLLHATALPAPEVLDGSVAVSAWLKHWSLFACFLLLFARGCGR